MRKIAIDFEFNSSKEYDLNVVCAVLYTLSGSIRYNLYIPEERIALKTYLQINKKDIILLAYAAEAEARCFLTLGLNPLDYTWVDLYVEFRMLCNSNNKFEYGKYIDKNGEEQYSHQVDLTDNVEDDDDEFNHASTPKNLVNCVYKLLNIKLDIDQKHDMRDLVITGTKAQHMERMEEILDYCESDTQYLIAVDLAIQKQYLELGIDQFRQSQHERAEYSVAMASVVREGMPLDLPFIAKIQEKTPVILDELKLGINKHIPYFVPEYTRPPEKLKNGKIREYKSKPARKDTAILQDYIKSLNITTWPTTGTGKLSTKKSVLEEYRGDQVISEIYEFQKMEANLKWFRPKVKDEEDGFFSHIGSDGNVRPYFGIFGTQTGRNAAKAKSFPLAMSHWLRSIVKAKDNEYIVGADFSQQEVYVGAVLSKDNTLYEAYLSGDVYLAFGKQCGAIPQNGTKKDYKDLRDMFKSTVLGKQYGMGAVKLQAKLRLDTKKDVSIEKATELSNLYNNTYSVLRNWMKNNYTDYQAGLPLLTTDGWALWCDNQIATSVMNFPIQANSASITRLAVVEAVKAGLRVIAPLHDAIYLVSKDPENDRVLLENIMLKATEKILGESQNSTKMRIDSKIFSSNDKFLEEKGYSAWENLKKHFV